MSDEMKAPEEKPVGQPEKMLGEYKSPELDESDKKIAKKRAKKNNIPLEAAEEGRRQEKNIKLVQALTNEYNAALNELGFVLEAVLKFSPKGIVPGFDLRPMNAHEMAFFKGRQEAAKAATEKAAEQSKANATPTEEPKEPEADVEPLEVPKV